MSSHADKVRELERAVLDATVAERVHRKSLTTETRDDWEYRCERLKARSDEAVDALLAARAETCEACNGETRIMCEVDPPDYDPCPSGCDNGRRRTT